MANVFKNFGSSRRDISLTTDGGAQPPGFTVHHTHTRGYIMTYQTTYFQMVFSNNSLVPPTNSRVLNATREMVSRDGFAVTRRRYYGLAQQCYVELESYHLSITLQQTITNKSMTNAQI